MSWADRAIEQLQGGEQAVIRPVGNSMRPIIYSKARVTLRPVDRELQIDDVVLVKVKGRVYLHLIKALDADRVLIGNNRGRLNGWTSKHAVYGLVDHVEQPT